MSTGSTLKTKVIGQGYQVKNPSRSKAMWLNVKGRIDQGQGHVGQGLDFADKC